MLTSVDSRFTRAAERGIIGGWKITDAEKNLREKNKPHDTSFIYTEYNAVAPFRKEKFRSKKYDKLAKEYIGALKECVAVREKYDPDSNYDEFWAHFSEPYSRRIKALYALQKGGRQFDISHIGYEEESADLMVRGWALNKAEQISFKTKTAKSGKRVYTAKVKNDSGYSLAFVDFTVELYDNKGKLLETDSAYAENIKRNDIFELKFYEYPARAASYAITSVNCQRKSRKSTTDKTDKIDSESTLR